MKKLILTIFVFLITIGVSNGQVAVIAHKDVPASELEKSQLLDFYIGDIKKWSDDTPVILFDLKTRTITRQKFYKFLGKTPSRMKSIWMKNMLSGEGEPPKTLDSEEEVMKHVAQTKGVIGFVDAKLVNDSVKRLMIIAP